MAWKDSALDHAGGEGMHGEMFWAAVESAAFVETDPMTLIRLGLNMIPLSSHVARSIKEAVWCHDTGLSWGDARERIAQRFGHIQPCNAVPNHGFTVLGWLYGRDFGDRLCKAVNCSYDTDCTGATLGSLSGILEGTAGIPQRWRDPVGEGIVLHAYTRFLNAPKNISELTDRTVALPEKAAASSSGREFGTITKKPADMRSRLYVNAQATAARAQDIHAGRELVGEREVTFHYGGAPVLYPGIAREVRVTVAGDVDAQVELTPPAGWTCERLGKARFRVHASGEVADRSTLTVTLEDGGVAGFTLLGPGEDKGFAAGDNVEKCPRCQARVEACICKA
jgi:hypothetical protein